MSRNETLNLPTTKHITVVLSISIIASALLLTANVAAAISPEAAGADVESVSVVEIDESVTDPEVSVDATQPDEIAPSEPSGTPVNPPAAEAVVDPTDISADVSATEVGDAPVSVETAPPNPMIETLSTVTQTIEGVEASLLSGDMSEAEAMDIVSDLQTIVDLIEATRASY